MTQNPYANGGGFTSDEFNGLHGAYSPDAIINQLLMKSKPSDNPYDAMLDHSTDFKPLPTPKGLGQKTNQVPTNPYDPNAMLEAARGYARDQQAFPLYPGAPPATTPPIGSGVIIKTPPPSNSFGVGGGFTPATTTPPAQTPVPQVTIQQPGQSQTGNVDAATYADAQRYVNEAKAKGWDYSYLLQQPQLITEFRNWAIANNAQSVDIVDYLAARHLPSPGAKRSGSDTFAVWQAQQNTGTGRVTSPGTDPGRGMGTGAPVPAMPPGTSLPPQTPTTPLQPSNDYLANLDRALQASQSNEYQNSLRQLRSSAAATGAENSGAYISSQGQLATDLAARFGQQRAELMQASSEAERGRAFQGSQAELDRVTQRYGIDVNAYTSRWNTATTAGAQQAATQMQYDLSLRGIQVDKDRLAEDIRNHTLGYNLGVGQQDLSKLQGDQQLMIQIWNFYKSIGQEETFYRLFGAQAPPTNVSYTP